MGIDNRYVVKELGTGLYLGNPKYRSISKYVQKTPFKFASRMEAQRQKNRTIKLLKEALIQAPDLEVIRFEDI